MPAPVPATTGAIASGRVRRRAPEIQSRAVARRCAGAGRFVLPDFAGLPDRPYVWERLDWGSRGSGVPPDHASSAGVRWPGVRWAVAMGSR
ncbi:hypothetical protein GCM10025877_19610 [Agromyces mangrovi Wang et al. 2018]|nr:hypothetical protein GCM10025877_19610 [Agromyces mangrovi]